MISTSGSNRRVPSESEGKREKKSNGKEESLFSVFGLLGQTGTKRRSIGIEYK